MDMTRFPDMPERIKALPIDHRGFPVPYFVAWFDGKPDHRVMDGAKLWPAINKRLCWICGQPLGANDVAFPLGPMCTINRTTSEPPSHRECATFAIKTCPFLSIPAKARRANNLPGGLRDAAGVSIKRNPGVTALWICERYQPYMVGDGVLFTVGQPSEVEWYAEGRAATNIEVAESVAGGLPLLFDMAYKEGFVALEELRLKLHIAVKFFPQAPPLSPGEGGTIA